MSKAKRGQLIESNGDVDELIRLEKEINEGLSRFYEDEYYVAVRLRHLKGDIAKGKPGPWTAVAKTWGEYCESGRIACRRSYADSQIAYSGIRADLADVPATAGNWTEYTARPLTKLKNRKAIQRISQAAVKEATDSKVKLTGGIVERLVKEELAKLAARNRTSLVEQENEQAETALPDYLRACTRDIRKMRRQFDQVPAGAWDTVENDFPNLISRMVGELNGLAAFLRGE